MGTSAQNDFVDHYGWDGDLLDLEAYFDRIDYRGGTEPTLDNLASLAGAHLRAVPFENLDVMHGKEIRIDVPGLQDKIVRRRRGGYCYEANGLLGSVLERLGYRVTGLNARILGGSPDHVLRSAAHTALLIDLDGRRWFLDVGVGSFGIGRPLELTDGFEAEQYAGRRARLDRTDHDMWVFRVFDGREWSNAHKFDLSRAYRADYVDANYIAQHHPRSPFHKGYVLSRHKEDEIREIQGLKLKIARAGAEPAEKRLEPEELPGAIEEHIEIALTGEEREAVLAKARDLSDAELTAD
ncbi:arylamine N-acetyltransferase family protein [Salininema proteolyticum]|uniref:Arylamine N-acetyltransferase n=1 Tax=Salininema proteolyticum TaxID=1607685 RepID=A0ABV8U2B3_9ACTN